MHELELRLQVVWQLSLLLGGGQAKVIVEAHRLFHLFQAVAAVEARIERTGRSRRTGVEEPGVLDGEVFGAADLPESRPPFLYGSEIDLREREPLAHQLDELTAC